MLGCFPVFTSACTWAGSSPRANNVAIEPQHDLTTSCHAHEPLQQPQHPPNASAASSPNQQQSDFFNSNADVSFSQQPSKSSTASFFRSRGTSSATPSTSGDSPTLRQSLQKLLRRRRAAAAFLPLPRLQQLVSDFSNVSSTRYEPTHIPSRLPTSRRRQSRRRAAAASCQCSRNYLSFYTSQSHEIRCVSSFQLNLHVKTIDNASTHCCSSLAHSPQP